jgi:peptidoglycan/xylan/chitin deacetylase (PgdA/CDA1 family)
MITFATPVKIFADNSVNIPILCYHNFNPTVPGSMTITPQKLETQFKWLKDNGFTVIPLKVAVEYLQGKRDSLPEKSVVITVDDGWESAYTYLYPLAKKYQIPVTLFIYPQTISAGKHALTWNQLKELQQTGLFDIQGHTYSHPNFKQKQRKLSASDYEKFVKKELEYSKQILEEKMGTKVDFLAWPYGIYNDYLDQAAEKAGYVMAFSINAVPANKSHKSMAQPRYMVVVGQSPKTFANIVNTAITKPHVANLKQ